MSNTVGTWKSFALGFRYSESSKVCSETRHGKGFTDRCHHKFKSDDGRTVNFTAILAPWGPSNWGPRLKPLVAQHPCLCPLSNLSIKLDLPQQRPLRNQPCLGQLDRPLGLVADIQMA
jgi:hypothetical protein